MCGIAGEVLFDQAAVADRRGVERMTESLRHRGPDDGDVLVDGPVALGNRRLAVIDLSPRGHQPMETADGRFAIVFNGEIYNFRELRHQLEAKGHRFVSDTDTEVILHAYQEEGPACVDALRGMFAFAIWDRGERRLMLARDRVGKKPIFYQLSKTGLVFASEVRALLQSGAVPSQVDAASISAYLSVGYVPAPRSAFSSINKLPGGHYLIVENGAASLHRYWTLDYAHQRETSVAAALDEILPILIDAVKLRMIADVPLGAFLSGGIDSSVVVALMRQASAAAVRTFSIGFEEAEYDELAHAREVARACETDHHEFIVRPDVLKVLPRLVWHYGEPFADSSALPTFYLSEMARRSVTVALTGDGGDEAFLGYDRYRAAQLAALADSVPASVRRVVGRAAGLVHPAGAKSPTTRAVRFLGALGLSEGRRYAQWMQLFDDAQLAHLCTADFLRAALPREPTIAQAIEQSGAPTAAERAADADIQTYLPDDLLVKADIASMAHSLELRSPLLDHHVITAAARLPLACKLAHGEQKVLLRRIAARLLPASIVNRPKAGFGVPLDHWFQGGLDGFARDVLLSRRAMERGYFRPQAVRQYLDENRQRKVMHHARIWSLLMLELWHLAFVDAVPPLAPPAADFDSQVLAAGAV